MGDLHLNKAQKFFYFRTRILGRNSMESPALWKSVLSALSEIQNESGINVYGLALETKDIHIVFSTPYFNENILILDWEMRIRKTTSTHFSRPILCEPLGTEEDVKRVLLEIYENQLTIQKNAVHWCNPFNSLKLLLEGSAHARLFSDPLKIIFQPSLVLQFRKGSQKDIANIG